MRLSVTSKSDARSDDCAGVAAAAAMAAMGGRAGAGVGSTRFWLGAEAGGGGGGGGGGAARQAGPGLAPAPGPRVGGHLGRDAGHSTEGDSSNGQFRPFDFSTIIFSFIYL